MSTDPEPVLVEPFIRELNLSGFLSFDDAGATISLERLNVIIGPNGSGKSNMIEALAVLRAAPRDLPLPVRRGGLVEDWLWKGPPASSAARLTATVSGITSGSPARDTRYSLSFGSVGARFTVLDERIEDARAKSGKTKPYVYFGYENGTPMLNAATGKARALRREDIDPTQSILSQRRDPEHYPELTRLADALGRVRLYRTWHFGPEAPVRQLSRADDRTDILSENLDNLPARLSALRRDQGVKKRLVGLIRELAEGFEDFEAISEGGGLQLYLVERALTFPARRLSDGTLRFLCLAAILVEPGPASVVVLEEPELGLHPDLMPVLRDLLLEASTRFQLVVTTHSTQLADAFTDHADKLLVCERRDGRTSLTRLKQEDVDRERDHGSLGRLWMQGHIGGNALVAKKRILVVEGGGDHNDALASECRRAFTTLLERAGLDGRLPQVITVALHGRVHGMLAAGRPPRACELLRQGLQDSALPSPAKSFESIGKAEALTSLQNASKATSKGAYNKGAHSFALLSTIEPQQLNRGEWARRFFDTRDRLL